MEMFYYNPKLGKNTGDDNGWHAEIEEGFLTVTKLNEKTEEKYVVDKFKNKTGCEFDEENLWYSFDQNPEHNNFHIVPDGSIKITLSDWLSTKLGRIRRKVESEVKNNEISGITVQTQVGAGTANSGCTKNHKWVCANSEKYQYLMSFNRLWCDRSNHICNSFGQAQFMCYPTKKNVGGINLLPVSDEAKFAFKMMYPSSDRDGKYNGEGTNFAYNAPYDINDDAQEIAECFAEFIRWCEKLFENDDSVELKNDAEFIKWCDEYGKNI